MSDLQHKTIDIGVTCSAVALHWGGYVSNLNILKVGPTAATYCQMQWRNFAKKIVLLVFKLDQQNI